MKKILLIASIIAVGLFTGCASSSGGAQVESTTFKFEKVQDSESIYKATYSEKGKKNFLYTYLLNAMNNVKKAVKKEGYQYFQIVSPASISNIDGSPINSTRALTAFVVPQVMMPTEGLNFLETRKTLMDNQNGQKVVDVPFTIFEDTTFNLVIRAVKKPSIEEIVWDVDETAKAKKVAMQ